MDIASLALHSSLNTYKSSSVANEEWRVKNTYGLCHSNYITCKPLSRACCLYHGHWQCQSSTSASTHWHSPPRNSARLHTRPSFSCVRSGFQNPTSSQPSLVAERQRFHFCRSQINFPPPGKTFTMSLPLKMQYYRPEALATPAPITAAPDPVQNERLDSQSPPPQKPAKADPTPSYPRRMENGGGREYKYFTEISQMMFVFGEVQDPLPETVNLVEDIIRSQIIELVGGIFSTGRFCCRCDLCAEHIL
jgi:hypothetical protein